VATKPRSVATAAGGVGGRPVPAAGAAVAQGFEGLLLDALSGRESAAGSTAMDRLRLTPVPLVPEVRLLLAEDSVVLWARLEADAGRALPPPFWATAWPGGQALARYVLDHPTTVAGRQVLDLASGSGLVAIAAAFAGAALVTANDVDPYAMAAISSNARTNGVDLARSLGDLLDGDGDGVEVVLAGDVLYNPSLAARMLPFLARVVASGGRIFVGDPDRGQVPHDWLELVATYQLVTDSPEDAQRRVAGVLTA
jgi:predicted nicotinamide N-methyase